MLDPPSPTSPLVFSEFGTRRRRSYQVHDLVMQGLCEGMEEHRKSGKGGLFAGSSNVLMALRYGVKPIGTIAHEWIMGVAAMKGYEGANGTAMDMWEEGTLCFKQNMTNITVYPASASSPLHTMLTDTFTAQMFFKDFTGDPTRALRWGGLRQDSGDAFAFVREAKKAWAQVEAAAGINKDGKEPVAKGKRVVFSDGLDVKSAIELQQGCDDIGMECKYLRLRALLTARLLRHWHLLD
jgi:nicotinate phosphoribosyltransferase